MTHHAYVVAELAKLDAIYGPKAGEQCAWPREGWSSRIENFPAMTAEQREAWHEACRREEERHYAYRADAYWTGTKPPERKPLNPWLWLKDRESEFGVNR